MTGILVCLPISTLHYSIFEWCVVIYRRRFIKWKNDRIMTEIGYFNPLKMCLTHKPLVLTQNSLHFLLR